MRMPHEPELILHSAYPPFFFALWLRQTDFQLASLFKISRVGEVEQIGLIAEKSNKSSLCYLGAYCVPGIVLSTQHVWIHNEGSIIPWNHYL